MIATGREKVYPGRLRIRLYLILSVFIRPGRKSDHRRSFAVTGPAAGTFGVRRCRAFVNCFLFFFVL